MTRLNLDAGRVWDQLLSSGGGCGSRLMRGGRQTLCVVFLLSVMVQPAARKPCSTDIITSVEYLIQTVSHQEGLDSELYTPTITDYRKCPKSTMTCFAKEAKVLLKERKNVPMLNKRLEKIAQMLNQSQLDCPECEVHTENATKEFLRNLLKVLQAINVEHCPPNPPAGG